MAMAPSGGLLVEIPKRACSDQQSQQSGYHEAAEQHRPVPGIEAEKPTISREAQCGEPEHRDNLCTSVTRGRWSLAGLAWQLFTAVIRQSVMAD
jgi:hypothetical protein